MKARARTGAVRPQGGDNPLAVLNARLKAVPPLALGIGISFALHAAVLLVHFEFPDASRYLRDKAMDVILVNARSARKPVDPQALAQANLDGGGDTDDDRRAKTPLPPSLQQTPGDDVDNLRKRAQDLEAQQQMLVAQAKSLRAVPVDQAGQGKNDPQAATSGQDLMESARAMARLESEIDKSVEEYNKRPRKKNVGVRAEEYRFARYVEDWRAKVERLGTLNYPDAARGKVYGSLLLTVALTADGTVKTVEINRSSGHKVLDEAARRIVQMGSPYSPFPPDIRRDTDILEITRVWSFTRGDTVRTQ